jgi:secreted trypsin-like serine protease
MASPKIFDSYIVGGVDAEVGEFPWQLSQQRLGSTWSHSCGASLLTATKALSAAHCVDGATVSNLRVIAGLHDRTAVDDGITSMLTGYKMHENYGSGEGTFPNDIAILSLAVSIADNGGSIQFASLPDDSNDAFVGRSCVMSGWGRDSELSTLPTILQKASINIISTDECNEHMSPVSGASVTDNMVCLFDTANQIGSCNGDSGGPLNCNYPTASDTRRVVFGVTSWGISSNNACLQTYPSVYTRTSTYLQWIADNTQ